MSEQPDPMPNGRLSTYTCTFGVYNQTGPWSDVRTLEWPQLTALLTEHQIGQKEGTCVVPATFSGTQRAKADAVRIDAVFLDSDAGYTLLEICAAVSARGWRAVISSSHSHLTSTTKVKRGNWDKFRIVAEHAEGLPTRYLVEVKGYLERVAAGASVSHETDEFTFFEHQPCPKFRVALPLLRPWLAAGYENQRQANEVWKERIEALAAALGLSHDQACTDTSRLFYLPRRPADGPPPETAILQGEGCDIFAPPKAEKARCGADGGSSSRAGRGRPERGQTVEFTDPETGEVFDLTAWARGSARGFEIASVLYARRPELFVPRPGEAPKRHIRCVNEDEHTQAGQDAATFVLNASQSTSSGFVYHCRHGHCDGRDRLLFLRKMLEQRWLTWADLNDPAFKVPDDKARPLIHVVGGQIPRIVDQAETALLRACLGLYQRGTFLVRPGLVLVTVSKAREVTAQRILEVGDHAMVEAMTRAADWERFDARSETWVAVDAPMKVAATYSQRRGRWRLPVLAGIINAPTLRADGTILAIDGYDPATGLLLDFAGVSFPSIPEFPSRGQAEQAIAVLDHLVSTFPFVDEASRSVALSTILTACIRRSLPTAPMHAFTAPTAGSGKSMLVDIASIVASGREAGVIAQGKTEEELEKRLGALLLAGEQVIAIDNCEAPLGGEFLCSMLTQQVVRPRILGKSEVPELPVNSFVTATGNNLVLIGDMCRRAVLSRLDPKHERPELRRFDSNPVDAAKADRVLYVVAALTVLRAYHVAGRPERPDQLGSYAVWSDWVRGALLWLGKADPVMTMEEARNLDPKLDALAAVIAQWRDVIGEASVSVRELIEHATGQHSTPVPGSNYSSKLEFKHPDFREALLAIAGEGGVINSKRFGKWLAANKDRVVLGLRITRGGVSAGMLRWSLMATDHDSRMAA